MTFACTHCGAEKQTLNGLCPKCHRFSSLEPKEPSREARQTAFKILSKHPDCLRDDVVLNDLIDDIALAIQE